MGSGAKPQKLYSFRPLQHPRLLEIQINTSRKIEYWKDFFQQNRSSSTFIKKKKGHINATENYLGGGTCSFCPTQF